MNNLTVAAVQIASDLQDAHANASKIVEWSRRALLEGADFVVFPECSLTGYTLHGPAAHAIPPDHEAVRTVDEFAVQNDIAIGYGFMETNRDCDAPFITYAITSPDGRLRYRKTHLGTSETPHFTPGDELVTAQIAGVCTGVQLCWEGHIADIATKLRSRGAELLIAPHAGKLGGARRLETWDRYLPARALDNGLFVVACNALRPSAPDEDAHSASSGGGIAAYGPDGGLIASYDGFDEHMVVMRIGGTLPRESSPQGMAHISYFDRRRPELYR